MRTGTKRSPREVSLERRESRDQIVDIKGSRAFPALLHKVQACNGDGEVA